MGLDMYLEGRTYLWKNWEHPEKNETRDGFRVSGVTLDLGYWRKHPDLHGYIVQAFADGKDECQKIPLTAEQMIQIVQAIKNKQLPKTSGFFFGASDGSEDKESIAIFLAAIKWLEGVPVRRVTKKPVAIGGGLVAVEVDLQEARQTKESREVIYRASW